MFMGSFAYVEWEVRSPNVSYVAMAPAKSLLLASERTAKFVPFVLLGNNGPDCSLMASLQIPALGIHFPLLLPSNWPISILSLFGSSLHVNFPFLQKSFLPLLQ